MLGPFLGVLLLALFAPILFLPLMILLTRTAWDPFRRHGLSFEALREAGAVLLFGAPVWVGMLSAFLLGWILLLGASRVPPAVIVALGIAGLTAGAAFLKQFITLLADMRWMDRVRTTPIAELVPGRLVEITGRIEANSDPHRRLSREEWWGDMSSTLARPEGVVARQDVFDPDGGWVASSRLVKNAFYVADATGKVLVDPTLASVDQRPSWGLRQRVILPSSESLKPGDAVYVLGWAEEDAGSPGQLRIGPPRGDRPTSESVEVSAGSWMIRRLQALVRLFRELSTVARRRDLLIVSPEPEAKTHSAHLRGARAALVAAAFYLIVPGWVLLRPPPEISRAPATATSGAAPPRSGASPDTLEFERRLASANPGEVRAALRGLGRRPWPDASRRLAALASALDRASLGPDLQVEILETLPEALFLQGDRPGEASRSLLRSGIRALAGIPATPGPRQIAGGAFLLPDLQKDPRVRAFQAFSRIAREDPAGYLALLEEALASPDPALLKGALLALSAIEPPKSKTLESALDRRRADPDPAIQSLAWLARLGPFPREAALRQALLHPSAEVRRAACSFFESAQLGATTLALLERFDDPDAEVRDRAHRQMHAVGVLYGRALFSRFAGALASEPDVDLRLAALRMIRCSTDPGARRSLEGALNDRDERVRSAAAEALRSLEGPKAAVSQPVWKPVEAPPLLPERPRQPPSPEIRFPEVHSGHARQLVRLHSQMIPIPSTAELGRLKDALGLPSGAVATIARRFVPGARLYLFLGSRSYSLHRSKVVALGRPSASGDGLVLTLAESSRADRMPLPGVYHPFSIIAIPGHETRKIVSITDGGAPWHGELLEEFRIP